MILLLNKIQLISFYPNFCQTEQNCSTCIVLQKKKNCGKFAKSLPKKCNTVSWICIYLPAPSKFKTNNMAKCQLTRRQLNFAENAGLIWDLVIAYRNFLKVGTQLLTSFASDTPTFQNYTMHKKNRIASFYIWWFAYWYNIN